jgi:hypothetical protein
LALLLAYNRKALANAGIDFTAEVRFVARQRRNDLQERVETCHPAGAKRQARKKRV